MRKIYVFLLMISTFFFNAYSFQVTGTVFNSKLVPIEGANVYIDSGIPVITSENGTFIVDVSSEFDLVIEMEGYNKYSKRCVIYSDSVFSVMLKDEENVNEENKDFFYTLSNLGSGGGFDLLSTDVLSDEKTFIAFDYFRIDSENKVVTDKRNVSNLRFGYGLSQDAEVGLSFFVTEDNNSNVLNEDNIFTFKKRFKFDEFDGAIALSFRDNSDNIIFVLEKYLQSDLLINLNINYSNTLSKEKMDIGANYFLSDNMYIFAELLTGYDNQKASTLGGIKKKVEDYDVYIYFMDNSVLDYNVYGVGFGISF